MRNKDFLAADDSVYHNGLCIHYEGEYIHRLTIAQDFARKILIQKGWGAFWLGWGAVLVLAVGMSVMAAREPYFPADLFLTHRLQGIDATLLHDTLATVNRLGDWPGFLAVYLAALMALLLGRCRVETLFLLLTLPLRVGSALIKELVERPRPLAELVVVSDESSSYSFPSGHAYGAVLLFGLLIYLLAVAVPWRPLRWIGQGVCLLIILLMGMARVDLGAHWPSDVIGSYLWGGLVVAVLIWAHRGTPRESGRS